MSKNSSFAVIGCCRGRRFLYNTVVAPRAELTYLGSLMAWMCRDKSFVVKAYLDGRMVMRKALEF